MTPHRTDRSSADRDVLRAADGVLERLDTHGVRRRDFLRLLSAGAAVAAGGSLLAACGGDDEDAGAAPASSAAAAASSSASPASSAGSSSTGAAAVVGDAGGKLAFLIMTNQLQYDVLMDGAAGDVAKELGFSYTGLDGKLDAQLQLNQFQQATAGGAKAVILHSPDGSNVEAIATGAQSGGVYLGNVWGTRPWYTPYEVGDYWTLYAQPDEFVVHGAVTKVLAEAIGGSGQIVRVSGVQGNTADIIRTAGANAALKEYPDVELAGELPGKWNAEDSQKAMQTLLSRFPDTKGVIAQNDDVATGVIAAIKAAGKKPGEDVFVVGADGTDLAAQRIASGEQLGTTANVPAYAGYLLVTRLHDVLNGWQPRVPERMLQWESVILTKENVDPYLARYVEPKTPPFSARLLSKVQSGDAWDPQFKLYPMDDLDVLWTDIEKPSGWVSPAAYEESKAAGEFDAVREEYAAAYTTDILGPAPAV